MTVLADSPSTPRRTPVEKPKLWTKDFVMGTVVNFFIAANYFMLMVVMTAYAMDVYAAPASAAAFCASVFIIGTLVSRFISVPLMARFGRKTLLIIATCLVVAFTALYFVHMPLEALMGVRFGHGMAYGVCSTTIATIVTSIVPASRKGEGIGYYMLSVTLGSAIGPFIGVFLSRNIGYEVLFIVACAVTVAAIPCILLLHVRNPRPQSPTAIEQDVEAAEDDVAATIAAAPQEAAKEETEAEHLEASVKARDKEGPSPKLEAKVAKKLQRAGIGRFFEVSVIPISFVCGFIFFGYSSLLTFLTPYSVEIGLSRAASVFFVAYALAIFLTRPFTGRAFDRYGPDPVMIPAFFSFSAGMILIAFATNDWMLLGSALLAGFGVGTIQSSGLAMAVRATPDERLSLANATYYMLIDIGVGVGPLLLGIIIPFIGYSNMYLCMAAVGMLSFILFLIVRHTMPRRS